MIDTLNTEDIRTPISDVDLWSDAAIRDPYPYYRQLRDLGPAVWLSRYNCWAVARHSSVREALLNAEVFTSSSGIAMNAAINQNSQNAMICSDDPDHARLRRVFSRPLLPGAVAALKDRLVALARQRVDELVAKGEFEAVTELAHLLPLAVVTELVGLGDEGKKNMLRWAAGIFDSLGPEASPRTLSGLEVGAEAFTYLASLPREALDPDGWAAGLFRAADEGALSHEEARNIMMDYTAPALDTTINGLGNALSLFARFPEQWERLRAEPDLVPRAIEEALRLETPIRAFSRRLTREYDLDGVRMRAGDWALIIYASANRDERRYEQPEAFDIARDARDHLSFGYGMHMCPGMHLAKLEIRTVLDALIPRVKRIHLVEEEMALHNVLRGREKLVLRIEPAGAVKGNAVGWRWAPLVPARR